MPWRRRQVCGSGRTRVVCWALGTALGAGVAACLLGSLLHRKVSPLLDQYTRFKQVSANYSKEEIQKAMERLKDRAR